jgi:hypothetical protein
LLLKLSAERTKNKVPSGAVAVLYSATASGKPLRSLQFPLLRRR